MNLSYPVFNTKEEIPDQTDFLSVVGVGTENRHSLYLIEEGRLVFLRKINIVDNSLPLFATKEDAIKQATPGQIVRVGYPKSYLAYRVGQSKDEKGELTNVLNFLYIN